MPAGLTGRNGGEIRPFRGESEPIRLHPLASRGFWHVGQFAADYRRAFGETPSATLNRRRSE
jgi:hypothetical protein